MKRKYPFFFLGALFGLVEGGAAVSWLQLDFSFVAGGRTLAGYWLGDDHGLCENYHLGSLWEITENTAEV